MFGAEGDMDDLSNRDLSQVPADELTPAEREELKRRLDAFVAVMWNKVFTPGPAPGPKTVAKWDPHGHGGEG